MSHKFAATIGVFDGVHRGHRFLIERLKTEARQRGLGTMVITFARHPRQVLCPDWRPQLLTTPGEKEVLLRQTGVDRVVMLPFDQQMAQLSARQFMEQVLHKQLGVLLLLTGYDNHFGHRSERAAGAEGFADYVAYGRELGMEVVGGQPLREGDVCFSSSLVRRLVSEGDVTAAAHCLGRPYELSGQVVHGEQIGRELGFPTANLQPADDCKLLPLAGVYAVWVSIGGSCEKKLRGMMNIGHRPTFDGHRTTLEVHILDYSNNLYGQDISVAFVRRLRDERHFDTREALVAQMGKDRQQVEQIFSN